MIVKDIKLEAYKVEAKAKIVELNLEASYKAGRGFDPAKEVGLALELQDSLEVLTSHYDTLSVTDVIRIIDYYTLIASLRVTGKVIN